MSIRRASERNFSKGYEGRYRVPKSLRAPNLRKIFYSDFSPKLGEEQRWSRGHKARGQGQGHKKNPRPRPRTAFPRTDPLEAKAKDQGHSRKCFQKKKDLQKKFFRQSPTLRLSQNFWLGSLNHKSHAMTSSKIFKRETFRGTKIS